MTVAELEGIFRSIDWQSLSDEELNSFHALLSLKESEIKWILNCRKHHRSHFGQGKAK